MHPDDALRRLAKVGRAPVGPTIYVHRNRPFDAFRAMFLIVFGCLLLLGGVTALPFLLPHNEISVTGLERVTSLTPDKLKEVKASFVVRPQSELKKLKIRVDGRVANVAIEGDRLRWVPEIEFMGEGQHKVTLESGGRFLWRGPIRKEFTVIIDSVAPTVDIKVPDGPNPASEPLTVTGTVERNTAIEIDGIPVPVSNGTYTHQFPAPPIGLVRVKATDAAGNVTMTYAKSNVKLPQIRGVHMSALSWLTPDLKGPVMALADAGKINTIQLDLKDENGVVGYRSALPHVRDFGANDQCSSDQCYDLASAVKEIHDRGLRVVGRVVAFRDPLLTRASVNAGRFDEVIMRPDGSPHEGTYGYFANPAAPAVQKYLLNIIDEATKAGVDDILFDYIRRPEGEINSMMFAGVDDSASIDGVIVDFLEKAGKALAPSKARLGVSVFGIAAKEPDSIAQRVDAMARYVDYVAPMVYPSHFRSGYYNVTDPVRNPYEIVSRSLKDFKTKVSDTDAVLVPWLQDFSLGANYGADQVKAQILAADENDAHGFLLWDPKVTYTPGGIVDAAPEVPIWAKPVTPSGKSAPAVPATIAAR